MPACAYGPQWANGAHILTVQFEQIESNQYRIGTVVLPALQGGHPLPPPVETGP
ncbi:MAG: hypothetical protein WB689_38715 [Xanthobacteraceae bacterium]